MVIAYQRFKDIEKLEDNVAKHREWLKDYEGKKFSKGYDGIDLIKWKNTKYSNRDFSTDINKVGELGNRLRIEFDGDEKKAKEFLEIVYDKLKEKKWGFIRSSHKGKSDYLWIEFTRNITAIEKKNFLMWIAPDDSEIDLNFSSPNFCFPVLFAIHWKHSMNREIPLEYFEGEQIDYDSLNIKKSHGKIKITKQSGMNYKTFHVFTRKGQSKAFFKQQPFFYDRSGLWWFWNKEFNCWIKTDEVDILNYIEQITGADVITSKERTEILNSLKQEGRKNLPKPIKPTWLQFKDKIFDIKSGETFTATPEYFVTNPIPYKMHDRNYELTPTMDKIFTEWVGEENIKILYEIIAYCLIPDYPIHRLFCLIGSGMNGKSCFLNLLRKFIGNENCTSTELDTLLLSRFEVTRLHKKLVCIMGETNFAELSKTSLIKKLTGGDFIGFEYKNKNPFEDYNYAKIIIATNNLPETTDKSIGFYRRWLIIDFPNQFSEQKDILLDIPEEEYEALALKCTGILNDLLKKRKFSYEGSIEDRAKLYEDKSNPFDRFIKENCNLENPDGFIWKFEFEERFNQWCKENRFRGFSDNTIGRKMKNLGIGSGRKTSNDKEFYFDQPKQWRCWLGIEWK